MHNKQRLGNILLLTTAIIWGTAFVGQRVGMDSIEPISFVACRSTLSAVSVALVALIMDIRNRRTSLPTVSDCDAVSYTRNTITGGICCGIFLASACIFQQIGVVHTTAGKAGFITSLYMLLVPVVNFLVFHKKNTLRVWLAVLAGTFGLYLLCVTEDLSFSRGDTFVCICAFMYCGHILCCDYFVQLGNPVKISAIQFVTVAVIAWAFALVTESPTPDKIVSAVIPIIYCGIVSGGIAFTLQIVAQKFTDPTVAALILSLESVFAVIAGTLLLHETMTLKEAIGCVIMFVAIIITQLPSRKNKA